MRLFYRSDIVGAKCSLLSPLISKQGNVHAVSGKWLPFSRKKAKKRSKNGLFSWQQAAKREADCDRLFSQGKQNAFRRDVLDRAFVFPLIYSKDVLT